MSELLIMRLVLVTLCSLMILSSYSHATKLYARNIGEVYADEYSKVGALNFKMVSSTMLLLIGFVLLLPNKGWRWLLDSVECV